MCAERGSGNGFQTRQWAPHREEVRVWGLTFAVIVLGGGVGHRDGALLIVDFHDDGLGLGVVVQNILGVLSSPA